MPTPLKLDATLDEHSLYAEELYLESGFAGLVIYRKTPLTVLENREFYPEEDLTFWNRRLLAIDLFIAELEECDPHNALVIG